MASRRKAKGRKIGAIALAAGVGVGGGFVLVRKRGGASGEDRIEPGTTDASTPPPAPAAVAEDSARGHSTDAAEQRAPVRPASAGPLPQGEALAEPPHGPPPGAVMPDTSAGDPLVDAAVNAAAAQAGSIGGTVDQLAQQEPVAADDPAMRPVLEGSGDDEETFEETSGPRGTDREKPL